MVVFVGVADVCAVVFISVSDSCVVVLMGVDNSGMDVVAFMMLHVLGACTIR